jgi:hypothetical protein
MRHALLMDIEKLKSMKTGGEMMKRILTGNRFAISLITFLIFSAMLFPSCSSIALYDEKAYEQATSLKVESLALMDKAVEPYGTHEPKVDDLKLQLEKSYEYAKGRPKNDISVKQWQILLDPERNLLGGFLKRWENESTLSPMFVKEAKGLIADAFDTIIGLESGKIKPGELEK